MRPGLLIIPLISLEPAYMVEAALVGYPDRMNLDARINRQDSVEFAGYFLYLKGILYFSYKEASLLEQRDRGGVANDF